MSCFQNRYNTGTASAILQISDSDRRPEILYLTYYAIYDGRFRCLKAVFRIFEMIYNFGRVLVVSYVKQCI